MTTSLNVIIFVNTNLQHCYYLFLGKCGVFFVLVTRRLSSHCQSIEWAYSVFCKEQPPSWFIATFGCSFRIWYRQLHQANSGNVFIGCTSICWIAPNYYENVPESQVKFCADLVVWWSVHTRTKQIDTTQCWFVLRQKNSNSILHLPNLWMKYTISTCLYRIHNTHILLLLDKHKKSLDLHFYFITLFLIYLNISHTIFRSFLKFFASFLASFYSKNL